MTQDEAYQKYQEQVALLHERFDCDCSQIGVVRRKIADGRIMVYEQCRRCGRSPKSLKKADFDIESLPWFDDRLAQEYDSNRQAAYESARINWLNDLEIVRQEQESQKREQSAEWWRKYNQYLRSQQWYDIRKRVLERDNNICQACLRNKASQVHHLSYELYDQLGRSAAFELVAICYQCHKAIHPHLAEAQHEVVETLHNPYLVGGTNGYR